jgi:hypothetical protein
MNLRTGKVRELIFSTSNPQEVARVMQTRLGKNALQRFL